MKIIFSIFLFLSFFLFFHSCGNSLEFKEKTKILDSLNTIINQIIFENKKKDIATFERLILQFNDYKEFVNNKIHDSIFKKDTEEILNFYRSGNNLLFFLKNRKMILSRAELINSQLNKIALDVKNNNLEIKLLSKYINLERSEIIKLSALNYSQLNDLLIIEDFLKSFDEIKLFFNKPS